MPHRRAVNIGQLSHHFPINCNKYYNFINKSHLVQIALTQAQNANQNPQSGDAIDYKIPHICPTPHRGLTLIGALL
jgi:hypothetical protein